MQPPLGHVLRIHSEKLSIAGGGRRPAVATAANTTAAAAIGRSGDSRCGSFKIRQYKQAGRGSRQGLARWQPGAAKCFDGIFNRYKMVAQGFTKSKLSGGETARRRRMESHHPPAPPLFRRAKGERGFQVCRMSRGARTTNSPREGDAPKNTPNGAKHRFQWFIPPKHHIRT